MKPIKQELQFHLEAFWLQFHCNFFTAVGSKLLVGLAFPMFYAEP